MTTMANKATGWTGSGTRPGNRSRARGNKLSTQTNVSEGDGVEGADGVRGHGRKADNVSAEYRSKKRQEGKGTVYWIDLSQEKDELFIAFANHHGMERRDAAKALMAVAMGLLPTFFWEPTEEGGFTGAERTNLVRQVFPKGSGHTNRGPHAVWKGTHAAAMEEMKGAPGGIAWVGLLVEKEKERLKKVMSGERGVGGRDSEDVIGGGDSGGLSYKDKSRRITKELEGELDEGYWADQRAYAKEQYRMLQAEERKWKIERGLIEDPTGVRKVDRIRLPKVEAGGDGDGYLDPYERERNKNKARNSEVRERDRTERESLAAENKRLGRNASGTTPIVRRGKGGSNTTRGSSNTRQVRSRSD